MKVRQNFEAVFVIAAVLGTFASFASATVPATRGVPVVQATLVSDTEPTQVVYITAKRLTPAEKAALN